ncbi:MAG: hypothetical protein PUP93_25380 [Rhizonema sp. NSF051]|nr:hypothetical protein [Rhizonema sp. NSF051]
MGQWLSRNVVELRQSGLLMELANSGRNFATKETLRRSSGIYYTGEKLWQTTDIFSLG